MKVLPEVERQEILQQISRRDVPQHIDEIEKLEKSDSSGRSDFSAVIDHYITGILQPLGMQLMAVKPGDLFDPKTA